jgi:hypothetical protein
MNDRELQTNAEFAGAPRFGLSDLSQIDKYRLNKVRLCEQIGS